MSRPTSREATRETRRSGQGVEKVRVEGDAASPKLPHKRDQSGNVTAATPDPKMHQAKRDLDRGLQPTDRSTEADQAYKKQK